MSRGGFENSFLTSMVDGVARVSVGRGRSV